MGAAASATGTLPTVRMVRVWSVEDVGRMLDAVQLGRYREAFRQGRVNGKRLLGMSDAALAAAGVHNASHRAQLLAHVSGIKQLDHTADAATAAAQQAAAQQEPGADDPDAAEQERLCPSCMHVGQERRHCDVLLTVRTAGLEAAPMPAVGETLHGAYLVTRELPRRGNGGTVAVFEAMDLQARARVVIKTPAAGLTPTITRLAVARLTRELLNASQVEHQLVMRPLRFAQTRAGRVFTVLEYLPGVTVRELLADGPIADEADVVGMLTDVLTALKALHERGLVYRDLRPDNVFCGPAVVRELAGKHTFRLGDLSLVKPLSSSSEDEEGGGWQGRMPKSSSTLGHPAYVAPEAFRGLYSAASDVWAAGVLAFECVVGRVPFGDGAGFDEQLEAVLNVAFPVDAIQGRCSPGLLLCVMRALQKDRRDRYGSAQEFLDALAEHTEGAAHDLKAVEEGAKRKDEIVANLEVARDELSRGPLKKALTVMLTHSVREINLRRADVDISDLETLTEGLKVNSSVVELDIGGLGPRVGDAGAVLVAEALRMNRTIAVLKLFGDAVGAEGAAHLAQAVRLNGALRVLDLSNNALGDEGVVQLCAALRVNHGVRDLNLRRNGVGSDGLCAVAEMLKENNALRRLHLGHNALNTHVADDGALALGEALTVNTVLEWVEMARSSVSDQGVAAIAEGLAEHPALAFVGLARTNVRDATPFLALLRKQTVLKEVDLRHNDIAPDVAARLRALADEREDLVVSLPAVGPGGPGA